MPEARRPSFGGDYGVPDDESGMLPWSWAAERLAQARNYWVAAAGPHASPVWALWHDGAIVFGCAASSAKARAIARNPTVVVHLESGDEVVIVHGKAEPFELTPELADAYERKYAFKVEPGEGWYRVAPRRVLAWTEAAYPRDATRFDF